MKAASFDYLRPQTLEEALATLAVDDEARIIAGGQSLNPMLAMRLARPTRLVDVYRLSELRGVKQEGDSLILGSATRQAEAEESGLVRRSCPLLSAALPWIGHRAIRARGTIGGSIANGDPAAELQLVAATLGAEIRVRDQSHETAFSAEEFFVGSMQTAAAAGGCLTEIRLPVWRERHVGAGFEEVSARRSDFAYVAAAAQVAVDPNGRCLRAALGVGAVADRPVCVDLSALTGERTHAGMIAEAVRAALDHVHLLRDHRVSVAYRRRAAPALAERAFASAWQAALAAATKGNRE